MGNVQVNAINGGSVTSTNQGWIQGEYMGCADGADSTADLTNLEGGQIAALDIFARGENAQMTAKSEGSAGELLANALAGGATTATNDGDVSLRTSGWSKGEGSSLTITNNGESGTMSAEVYLDGKASLTNNGLADGGMGGYTDGGRVDLVNNGEVNGNMAVGAEKEGHVSADNRESGTVYGRSQGMDRRRRLDRGYQQQRRRGGRQAAAERRVDDAGSKGSPRVSLPSSYWTRTARRITTTKPRRKASPAKRPSRARQAKACSPVSVAAAAPSLSKIRTAAPPASTAKRRTRCST